MANVLNSLSTAVLVLHYQRDVVPVLGEDQLETQLKLTDTVVKAARASNARVYFVSMGFSDDYKEISPNNKNGSMLKSMGILTGGGITPVLERAYQDPLIVTHRISAFYATELDLLLKAAGIDTLVMMGITTSGVMLSTLSHASDLDYKIYAIKDCCYDPDAIAHEKIFETAFATRSEILSASEVIKLLRAE